MAITARETGLGFRQTWKDMTASRANGTVYTNTTGRPIAVSVVGTYATSGAWMTANIDGIEVQKALTVGSGEVINLKFIVPAGSVYSVGWNAVLLTFNYWRELS